MMTAWRFIDSGACDAAFNMALDEAIAIFVRKGCAPPTLRLYGWKSPSVSLGSFQKIADIDRQYCSSNNIPIVRRPTGGRGILHGDELTYSFSSRSEGFFSGGLLSTYRCISAALHKGLDMAGIKTTIKNRREPGSNLTRGPLCFESVSYGELTFSGRKLIGSAQKRWRDGFLQQGAIPYLIDIEKIRLIFKSAAPKDTGAAECELNRHAAPGCRCADAPFLGLKELLPDFNHEEFKLHLKLSFENAFNVTLAGSRPSHEEMELARFLESEKYLSPLWTEAGKACSLTCSNSEKSKKAGQG